VFWLSVTERTEEADMAKIAKSKDTANWRKGKDLTVGDLLAVRWEGKTPVEFSPIAESLGKVPYMGVTNYRYKTESGHTKTVAGGEFAQGRYTS
jgi:hypothetical protein